MVAEQTLLTKNGSGLNIGYPYFLTVLRGEVKQHTIGTSARLFLWHGAQTQSVSNSLLPRFSLKFIQEVAELLSRDFTIWLWETVGDVPTNLDWTSLENMMNTTPMAVASLKRLKRTVWKDSASCRAETTSFQDKSVEEAQAKEPGRLMIRPVHLWRNRQISIQAQDHSSGSTVQARHILWNSLGLSQLLNLSHHWHLSPVLLHFFTKCCRTGSTWDSRPFNQDATPHRSPNMLATGPASIPLEVQWSSWYLTGNASSIVQLWSVIACSTKMLLKCPSAKWRLGMLEMGKLLAKGGSPVTRHILNTAVSHAILSSWSYSGPLNQV